MSPQERTLPLFPLTTVLFPNATMPLQIFEERYKLMLQHSLDNDSKFGVVLIKSGIEVGGPAEPFSVGTRAHIVQVNKVEGGRMFISITGQQRFRIKNITQYRPYMAADVELLEEDEGAELSPEKVEEIRKAANQYISLVLGLRGGWVRKARTPSDPAALSYFIGGMLQLELIQKQGLLEESDLSKRLETELGLLSQKSQPLKQQVARELRRKFSRQ